MKREVGPKLAHMHDLVGLVNLAIIKGKMLLELNLEQTKIYSTKDSNISVIGLILSKWWSSKVKKKSSFFTYNGNQGKLYVIGLVFSISTSFVCTTFL